MSAQDSPVFVRGFSRSGGTLVVTLLDAHPEIAMSYELYPRLLATEGDVEIDWAQVGRVIRESKNLRLAARRMPTNGLRTFVSRCERGGLGPASLAELLDDHMGAGLGFESKDEKLRFIERCAMWKAKHAGKKRWGLKCNNSFGDYLRLWPKAAFLDIVRDGRDVLASQLNTGSFTNTPAEVGKGWANTHRRFGELMETAGVRAKQVFYERLVSDPEGEVRELCEFLEVEYDPDMLRFHQADLSVYQSHHLSMDRISAPIDETQVGRWRKEVSPEQLAEFISTAGDVMREFGYLEQ